MSVADKVTNGTGGGKHCNDYTWGSLLGGRVKYAQPRQGFRSGIEPVLLAASVPARSGQRVLEGGSGAGATLLCLAARVAGTRGMGIERDAGLVDLARMNVAANDWPGLEFTAADMEALPALGLFEHACANPPYHPPRGTASPDASRRLAKQGSEGLLATWAAALARHLRPGGTLTFILPTESLPRAMAAFSATGCQPTAMLPLWPKVRRPAKLLLLRGVKGSRSPLRVLPGLVLHEDGGGFTEAAASILREAAALPM